MSADIVNLRQARKAKARADKQRQAEENRVRFGRSKADKQHDAAVRRLDTRKLDGQQRSKPGDRDDEQG